MRIRLFQPADLQALYEIDQACFPPGVSYTKGELSRFISKRGARTWVAEEGAEIVGFLVVGRASQEVGHIVTIDVVSEWRRQGVGGALMNEAEHWAREQGIKMLYLETAEDNLAAQGFYATRDYIKLEKIDHYYSDGNAAWVMGKSLKPERRRVNSEQ
jgi:ribosomal-protein-alanine N-acetyltransferase